MAENSKIEWTHHTFNSWEGCSKVSPGCQNCYAETRANRFGKVKWGPSGTRRIASEAYWRQPLKWNREAKEAGERRRVFCASLADVFEERPELREPRMRLFKLIGSTPNLDWLLLTKRPEVALEHWPLWAGYWCSAQEANSPVSQQVAQNYILPNVWVGASVEDQQRANERIPLLLRIPAKVRFLSCEPLLSAVDLLHIRIPLAGESYMTRSALHATDGLNKGKETPGRDKRIDWVIVGGESGPHARPMNLEWARSLAKQCRDADVACFVKQLGARPVERIELAPGQSAFSAGSNRMTLSHAGMATERESWLKDRKGGDMEEWPEDLRVREFPR